MEKGGQRKCIPTIIKNCTVCGDGLCQNKQLLRRFAVSKVSIYYNLFTYVLINWILFYGKL